MSQQIWGSYTYYKDSQGNYHTYDEEIGWMNVGPKLNPNIAKWGKKVNAPATLTDEEKAAAAQASLEAADDSGLAAIQPGGSQYDPSKNSILAVKLGKLAGPGTSTSDTAALRYPKDPGIDANSDYVAFEFYKYAPPFNKAKMSTGSQDVEGSTATGNFYDYNQAKSYTKLGDPSILLYMPEDISTGFRSNWGGKAMSTVARNAMAAAGQEGFNKLKSAGDSLFKQIDKAVALTGAAAIRKAVQKVSGDSLSNDDVFGAISGAILNPNVELLYQGTDLRNFQLNFKLVPRSDDESIDINKIVHQFKRTMLPSAIPGKVFGGSNPGTIGGFIGVPNLVKVSFMKGSGQHPVLPVFKMCALTQVDVNYTPDGAYATYRDGQPVALVLTLNFQETKMVFAEDLDQGIR